MASVLADPYDEYDDDSHSISTVIRTYGPQLHGYDAFQRAASALLERKRGDGICVPPPELISNGMDCISPEDRERALADLHGVGPSFVETPEMLQDCLDAMERHIFYVLPEYRMEAYRNSLDMDPGYAADPNFRLMFLRSVHYDPVLAVQRMAVHFAMKQTLFGRYRLARDITIDDIEPDALAILDSGYMQPLPVRDNSGRLVIIAKPPKAFTRTSLLVATWIALMRAVRHDKLTQQKGIVIVSYNMGPQRFMDHRLWRDLGFCTHSLPIHYAARHSLEDQSDSIVFLLNRRFMIPTFRIRFRQYFRTSSLESQQLQFVLTPIVAKCTNRVFKV